MRIARVFKQFGGDGLGLQRGRSLLESFWEVELYPSETPLGPETKKDGCFPQAIHEHINKDAV